MRLRIQFAAVCLLLTPLLGGCAPQPVPEFPGRPYSNSYVPFLYDVGDYLVSTVQTNRPEFCLKGENLFQSIKRDPFYSDEEVLSSKPIRPYNNGFFYMRETQTGVQIQYLNLDSFQEYTIYEQKQSRSISLFGVELWSTPASSSAVVRQGRIVDYCFLDNRLILIHNGYVTAVDDGKETILFEKEIQQFACFDGTLYYTDTFGNVFLYKLSTGETAQLEGIKAYSLAVDECGIVFTNRLDDAKLYRLPLTGGEAVKIGDMVPETFVVYKKDIWITSEGRLYYASTENTLLQEVLTNGAENISVLDQGATIYTTKYEDNNFVITHKVERESILNS